ncbi:hypothetical protein WKR88_13365 [Trinickia caryophylli]|uniref:Uncharacterized protein n=1 Tax=Trinickia caryophylli TaxID=28094 RepID=A0A1X7ELM4_TRICW|nr:hypothetical protein [Trinickia caryophylli]PMS08854.1 hypothetical protein C0Z17_28030 [Trinickia caryophylli]TRX18792.1 hypothetical protein FNF07_11555 [Trinickia caryophylli]WQE10410.1 hypothetical protein U0034_11365 [Trinickia caryophylli]SMF35958.1 hypothetical protein SAMN06295900_1069 [Trinickia caryophylli]GLU32756.1 hypothetical protein Busp01_25980 [Trinickia caryophylli]
MTPPLGYAPGVSVTHEQEQPGSSRSTSLAKYDWKALWESQGASPGFGAGRFMPPRDGVAQALSLVRDMSGEHTGARELYKEGRKLWFSVNMTDHDRILEYLQKLWRFEYSQFDNSVERDLRARYNPADESIANQLIREYLKFIGTDPGQVNGEQEALIWRVLNSNIYGRKFDSEVCRELVEKPFPEMMEATRQLGAEAFRELSELLGAQRSTEEKTKFLTELSRLIRNDVRPWFTRAPHVAGLIDDFDMHALEQALTNVSNGFEMISVPYLIVKCYNTIAMVDSQLLPQWFRDATANYTFNIVPKRSGARVNDPTPTSEYGIRLPAHPKYKKVEQLGQGAVNYTVKHSFVQPHQYNAAALRTGYPVVCGLSGSTNIVAFFIRSLKSRAATISEGAAILSVVAGLNFDGGHSLNETIPVYHATTKLPSKLPGDERQWRQWWNSHVGDDAGYRFSYDQLASLPDWTGGQKSMHRVLKRALSDTLDYFKSNDVLDSRNQDEIPRIRSGPRPLPLRAAPPDSDASGSEDYEYDYD